MDTELNEFTSVNDYSFSFFCRLTDSITSFDQPITNN